MMMVVIISQFGPAECRDLHLHKRREFKLFTRQACLWKQNNHPWALNELQVEIKLQPLAGVCVQRAFCAQIVDCKRLVGVGLPVGQQDEPLANKLSSVSNRTTLEERNWNCNCNWTDRHTNKQTNKQKSKQQTHPEEALCLHLAEFKSIQRAKMGPRLSPLFLSVLLTSQSEGLKSVRPGRRDEHFDGRPRY